MSGLQHTRRQKLSWMSEEGQDGELQDLLRREADHAGPDLAPPRGQSRFPVGRIAIMGVVLLGAAGGASLLVQPQEPSLDKADLVETATMSVVEKTGERTIGAGAALLAAEAKSNETPFPSAPPAAAPAPGPVRVASVTPVEPVSVMPAPLATVRVAAPPTAAAPLPDKMPEPVAAPAPTRPTPRAITMSAEEMDAHLSKAERALKSGDLAVARSFYGRVVNGGDARGALGMARTYDDEVLKKLPVFGQKGDRAEAAHWNARAQEMGGALNARLN